MLLFGAWIYVTMALAKPASSAGKDKGESRLKQALTQFPAQCKAAGVTTSWYAQVAKLCNYLQSAIVALVVLALVAGVALAVPESLAARARDALQGGWAMCLASFTHKQLFIVGVFGSHFVAFWGVCAFYLLLDLTRPAVLLQLKVQTDFVLTKKGLVQLCSLALVNQLVLLGVVWLIWDVQPMVAPHVFDAELPALLPFIVNLAACIPYAEFVFYGMHRLLHTPWMFEHIHYLHHTWTAPCAPCAIYAHPIEFLIGNVTVVAAGPFFLGHHLSVWIVWTALATANTIHGHSGWHLPWLGSPEGHDYHHSSGYIDNLGVVGVLDAFFKTDSHWIKSWYMGVDGNYGASNAGQYAADKIICKNSAPPPVDGDDDEGEGGDGGPIVEA